MLIDYDDDDYYLTVSDRQRHGKRYANIHRHNLDISAGGRAAELPTLPAVTADDDDGM